jgi:hypothetical protein
MVFFEILATRNAILEQDRGDADLIEPSANVNSFVFGGENAIASPWGYYDSSSGGLVCVSWVDCDRRFTDI